MTYVRSRASWPAWPDPNSLIRNTDLENFDATLLSHDGSIATLSTLVGLPAAGGANMVPVWNGSAWVAQQIADGQIAAGAGIAYSKLALAASVKNADLIGSGGVLADMPPGRELTYNEFTANVAISATTEATANTIVTASAFTFNGATPVIIEFFCSSVAVGAASSVVFIISDGGTSLGSFMFSNTAGLSEPIHGRRRLTPSNAAHTYSIRAYVGSAAATVNAGVGGPGVTIPGFIRISKA